MNEILCSFTISIFNNTSVICDLYRNAVSIMLSMHHFSVFTTSYPGHKMLE